MHKIIHSSLILPIILLSSCKLIGPSSDQLATVHAFKEASAQCLRDVRDSGVKYESSSSCNSLGMLSYQYLEVGGGREGSPLETEVEYAQALSNTWTARAISLSDGRPYNIW